jgi:hypothetical protein
MEFGFLSSFYRFHHYHAFPPEGGISGSVAACDPDTSMGRRASNKVR